MDESERSVGSAVPAGHPQEDALTRMERRILAYRNLKEIFRAYEEGGEEALCAKHAELLRLQRPNEK